MRPLVLALTLLLGQGLRADVDIDIEALGESLGGWNEKSPTVDYSLSGADYRTYQPEITPTPDKGIFVSLRIDHRRGWLASDDHAVLEVTFGPDGTVVSAQSSLAIQGRTISSDLVRGTAVAGARATGVEGAVKIGTDLVGDLSAKLLREKIVEAGRVNFPAALRHNYNLLYQAVRIRSDRILPAGEEPSAEIAEETEVPTAKEVKPLEIRPYSPKKESDGKK